MLEIYKGIKIEDEVIIVENYVHQGYLVCKGNDKQLESAMHWAKSTHYAVDENGKNIIEYYYKYESGKEIKLESYENGCYSHYKYETTEGIAHTYKNGEFRISLLASAGSSSQGGKLSFWNCTIVAPDGKEFIIGINQECLIQLLKNNTFVNGVCDKKVWLGRIKNNVGAFTENMEEFEQGKKDKAIRETKKTSNYDVGAILIPSNNVYCGKFYKTFDIWTEDFGKYGLYHSGRVLNQVVNIYTKPQSMYLYKDYNFIDDKIYGKIYGYNFKHNKSSSVLSQETANVNVNKLIENTKKYCDENKRKTFCDSVLAKYQKVAVENIQRPDSSEIFSLMYVPEADLEKDYVEYVRLLTNYFDKYKIPYFIDASQEKIEETFKTKFYKQM